MTDSPTTTSDRPSSARFAKIVGTVHDETLQAIAQSTDAPRHAGRRRARMGARARLVRSAVVARRRHSAIDGSVALRRRSTSPHRPVVIVRRLGCVHRCAQHPAPGAQSGRGRGDAARPADTDRRSASATARADGPVGSRPCARSRPMRCDYDYRQSAGPLSSTSRRLVSDRTVPRRQRQDGRRSVVITIPNDVAVIVDSQIMAATTSSASRPTPASAKARRSVSRAALGLRRCISVSEPVRDSWR